MNVNNVCQICGRLVRDPEMKATSEGTEYATFRVAVDRGFAKQGEEREADFVNIKAWRQTAAFVSKYFKKGQMIKVVGELRINQYMKDDQKREYPEIVAESVGFCGGKNESGSAPSGNEAKPNMNVEVDPDDLPF